MRFNGNLSIIAHGEIEHGYSGNDYVKTYGNVRNDVDTAWNMRSVDLIIATFMALVGLVSVFGNILLICTFYSCQSLKKKSANVLTIHLAVNNTLVGIVALKIGTLLFLQDTGQKVISSFGEVCQVEGAVLSFVHINVMLTIAAMFGDRYVAICFFGKKPSWLSICHHEPYKTILLIWIYSVFWAFWPLTPIVPDYILETSLPCCMFDRQTASFYNIFYLVGMSISVLVLPLTFVCFSMVRIFNKVKSSSKRFQAQDRRSIARNKKSSKKKSVIYKVVLPHCGSGKYNLSNNFSTDFRVKEISDDEFTSKVATKSSRTASQHPSLDSRKKGLDHSPEHAVLKSAIILVTTFSMSWIPLLILCLSSLGGISFGHYPEVVAFLLAKLSCVHSSYAYATHPHFKATIRYIVGRK